MMLPAHMMSDLATAKSVAPKLNQLKKASQAMEAHFIKDLLSEMQKGTDDNKPGQDFGGDTYKDLFNEAVSNKLSQTSNLGIANSVYKSLAPTAFNEERVLVAKAQAAAKAKPDAASGVKS